MIDMKQFRNIGQTSNNAKKEFSNEESHKSKDHPTISDKTKLLTEGSSEDNSEKNHLTKDCTQNQEKEMA
jgi:hypothetical protein